MELESHHARWQRGRLGHAARRDLRPRAARRPPCSAAFDWQLAKRQRRHAQDKGRARDLRARQEDVRAEGHRRRPSRLRTRAAVPRRRPCLRSGRAQPRARPAEEGARARAASTRCRPRPRTAASSCSTRRAVKDAKTKALRSSFDKLGLENALIIDGAEIETNFRARRAQHSEYRRAAGAGHQRLRHPAPREAGADEGRGRCAGGALQMSTRIRATTT